MKQSLLTMVTNEISGKKYNFIPKDILHLENSEEFTKQLSFTLYIYLVP
jgi:hypothetical protein